MTEQTPFKTIAVLGPGLLGGSVALAVRTFLPMVRVQLWGRRMEPLLSAQQYNAAHEVSLQITEVVYNADLIILATPVGAMFSLVKEMLPHLKQTAVVTDVGSVKACVHETTGAFLSEHKIAFVGSHPMAGSEKQGIEYAKSDLFRQATCILTNDEHVDENTLLNVQRFWEQIGCRCVRMSATNHDATVARISHIPHALATLCVHGALDSGDLALLGLIAGSGFRDTTRVAMGDPAMWAEILLENARAVQDRLEYIQQQLQHLIDCLYNEDKTALQDWLNQARQARGQSLEL